MKFVSARIYLQLKLKFRFDYSNKNVVRINRILYVTIKIHTTKALCYETIFHAQVNKLATIYSPRLNNERKTKISFRSFETKISFKQNRTEFYGKSFNPRRSGESPAICTMSISWNQFSPRNLNFVQPRSTPRCSFIDESIDNVLRLGSICRTYHASPRVPADNGRYKIRVSVHPPLPPRVILYTPFPYRSGGSFVACRSPRSSVSAPVNESPVTDIDFYGGHCLLCVMNVFVVRWSAIKISNGDKCNVPWEQRDAWRLVLAVLSLLHSSSHPAVSLVHELRERRKKLNRNLLDEARQERDPSLCTFCLLVDE